MQGGDAANRGKSRFIIQSGLLRESLGNEAHFVEHELTLHIDLALADPLATDELALRQYSGHFLRSMLTPESMNLSFICCVPLCSICSGGCLSKRSRMPVQEVTASTSAVSDARKATRAFGP